MLVDNGDQTFTAGPLDLLVILKMQDTGRYHVCFAEEYLVPGYVSVIRDVTTMRILPRMVGSEGAATLAEAQVLLDDLRKHIKIGDRNVFRDGARLVDDPSFAVLTTNWLQGFAPVVQTSTYMLVPVEQ